MRDAPAIEDIVRSARQIYVPSRCRVEEIEPESSTKRCAAIGRWGGVVLGGESDQTRLPELGNARTLAPRGFTWVLD